MDRLKNAPILLFLLVGFAIAGFKYLDVLTDSKNKATQIEQLKNQLQEKKTELAKAKASAEEIPSIKSEIDNLSQSLSHAMDLIPRNLTYREVLDPISKEAQSTGVHVMETKPLDVKSENYYDGLPITLTIEGSYSQLTNYMYLISREKIILQPQDMDLALKEIVDGQASLKMTGTIVGYRYKETK